MGPNGFSRSPDPQSSSRLIQLPTELRLMIFRNLLKNDKPFYSSARVGQQTYRDATHNRAQILRTCQQLYHEGLPILYHENTLSIFAGTQRRCSILNMSIRQPTLQEITLTQSDLQAWASSQETRYRGVMDMEAATKLSRTLPSLTRFKTFELVIEYNGSARDFTRTFIICYMLRKLFYQKEVIVRFNMSLDRGLKGHAQKKYLIGLLGRCKYLRCRSITFSEFAEEEVRDIVQLVTSREPVNDLFETWLTLEENFITKVPEVDYPDYHNITHTICRHAMKYDVEAFEEAVGKMQEATMVYLRAWVQSKKQIHAQEGDWDEETENRMFEVQDYVNATISDIKQAKDTGQLVPDILSFDDYIENYY